MIGIVFNHDIFDDPYNQTKVVKGIKDLEKLLEGYGEYCFSFGKERVTFVVDETEDFVLVHHTRDLTLEDKKRIADAVKETLAFKKSVYKNGFPKIVIMFNKIAEEDCFVF